MKALLAVGVVFCILSAINCLPIKRESKFSEPSVQSADLDNKVFPRSLDDLYGEDYYEAGDLSEVNGKEREESDERKFAWNDEPEEDEYEDYYEDDYYDESNEDYEEGEDLKGIYRKSAPTSDDDEGISDDEEAELAVDRRSSWSIESKYEELEGDPDVDSDYYDDDNYNEEEEDSDYYEEEDSDDDYEVEEEEDSDYEGEGEKDNYEDYDYEGEEEEEGWRWRRSLRPGKRLVQALKERTHKMEDKIELLRRLRHHKKANEYEIRVKNMKHLIDIIEGRAGKRKMMRDRRSLKTQKMSEYERQHRRPDAYERSEHHTVRPRRYAHRRHEEEDCSQPAPVSIPKLAAEAVHLEKEIQKKIASKLEQRLDKEVTDNVEELNLQREAEAVIENDIDNAVRRKLGQKMGSLPGKVRALEQTMKELKHELENSPWTKFQRLMMEHARENIDTGLSQSDIEQLELMHEMTPDERKAFMKSLRKKVRLDEDEEDSDQEDEEEEWDEDNEEDEVEDYDIEDEEYADDDDDEEEEEEEGVEHVPRKVPRKKLKRPFRKNLPLKKRKRRPKSEIGKANKSEVGKKAEPKKNELLEKKGKVRKGKKQRLRKGKKGPKKGRKGPKKGKKGPKKGKKGPKKGKKGPKRGKKGPKPDKKGPKKGNKRLGRGWKGPNRRRKKGGKKREKRAEFLTREWVSVDRDEEAPVVLHSNDPTPKQRTGAQLVHVKHGLPAEVHVRDEPVRRQPLPQVTTSHRLEWSGFIQGDQQPGSKNKRSIPDDRSSESVGRDDDVKRTEQCDKCEDEIGEEVCGSNGKTYNSLCHAIHCGRLREMDIRFGSCEDQDSCKHNHCSDTEICAAMTYGPCLSVYTTDGRRLPCRQYICVAKEDCGHMEYSEVCGVDGRTYPTLCHLQQRGIKLAYSGHCRDKLCRGVVCGRDGVTYPSSCHARAHNVRVDYKGPCFAEDLEDHVRSCDEVRETGLCSPTTCPDAVIPEGDCCPVCGGGVEVEPQAAQLAELARDWPEINHLYMMENFLRRLVPEEMVSECELSLTLTDSGAIMLVLEAVHPRHSGTCQAAAMEVAERINRPSDEDAALRPVVRTARLLQGLGGNMIQNSVQDQTDLITGDVNKMRSDTTNKMTGSYNKQMKSLEAFTSSGHALLASALLITTISLVTLL